MSGRLKCASPIWRLLHVPAEIVLGNSLSLDVTRILRTQARYLSNWDHRLKDQEESSAVVQPPKNWEVGTVCSGLINPDTDLGGRIAALNEVFNEKAASIVLD